jgi:ParB family transcriptional regulator, chromosome partitioning protein
MLENKYQIPQTSKNKGSNLHKNIVYIKRELIRPNPYQPRRKFDKAALEELSHSIKEYGILQPISVREISSSHYELVSGERRLRAATLAGLKEVPAVIITVNDDDSAVMALIENLQREDLSYMEEAEGYNNLINEHKFTQEELARKIGKSQSTIANKIRLLKLPLIVKKILTDNGLTERHARSLLKLPDEQLQLKVLKTVCDKGYNVKKTEMLVDKAIEKYSRRLSENNCERKFTKSIKDIRIFVNTIKQAIKMVKDAGVKTKAAQIDRGEYVEFIIRIHKN